MEALPHPTGEEDGASSSADAAVETPTTIPLTSGRDWERLDPQPALATGVNEAIVVQDRNDPIVRAFFKWPKANERHSSPYSIGIERVYYELGRLVGVPICDTYLEEVEGHHGLISLRAPKSKSWQYLADDIFESDATFIDRDKWRIAVGLDILLGNTDRHDENVFVQWDPPGGPGLGEECATWFIDFGHCGLWPPWKFDPNLQPADLTNIDAAAGLRPEAMENYRLNLPGKIRQAFPPRNTEERREIVEILNKITDDGVEEAMARIPSQYFTSSAADLTIRWIKGRLPRVDSLIDDVFPT